MSDEMIDENVFPDAEPPTVELYGKGSLGLIIDDPIEFNNRADLYGIKDSAEQDIEVAKEGIVAYNEKVFSDNSVEGIIEKQKNGEEFCTNEELAERITKVIDEATEKGEDVAKAVTEAIKDNVVFGDSPEAVIITVDGPSPATTANASDITALSPEILRKPGRKVEQGNFDEAQACAEKLYAALRTRPNSYGVAAQQVGHDLAMFIVKVRGNEILVVNPLIQKFSPKKNTSTYHEGCLSIPGKLFGVKRCNMIKLFFLDKLGRRAEHRFKQDEACIMQHLYDHTRGILISDIGKEMIDSLDRIVEL